MNTTYLGKLIKELRKRQDMRQEDLATQLNVTTSAVSKWENGKNFPDFETLYKLSQLFDVPIEDLYQPEEMLTRLNHTETPNDSLETSTDEMSVADSVVPVFKKYKYKKLIVCTALLIFIILASTGIFIAFQKQNQINIRPYGFRMMNDEIYGEVYEMGCIYSGNLEEITGSSPYILALAEDWKADTTIDPEIHFMRVSFYKTETDSRSWVTPNKVIYLYR